MRKSDKTPSIIISVSSSGKFSVSDGLEMNLPLFFIISFKRTLYSLYWFFHFASSVFRLQVSLFFHFFFFEEFDSGNVSVLIDLCFTQGGVQWLRLNY